MRAIFFWMLLMGIFWAGCENPVQKKVSTTAPVWDSLFEQLPDSLPHIASRKMNTFQHHALPPDVAKVFQKEPNEEEEEIFPFGKVALGQGHIGYLVSTDDDGDENVWLYVWDKTNAHMVYLPVYLAYQYCEEERCEGLVTKLVCPPAGPPQIIQQESSWFPTLDSIPDEMSSEKSRVLNWEEGRFVEL